jgi:hypothetical protein
MVVVNKLRKGGDDEATGMWWVVSFPPPRSEFSPLKPRMSVLPCVGHMEPRRPTNLWRTSRGSSSSSFHLRVREDGDQDCDEDGGV